MSTTTLTPNAPLAYASLDHLDANLRLWTQGAYYLPDPDGDRSRDRACFMGRALLLAGIQMTLVGEVFMDDVSADLADAVLEQQITRYMGVSDAYPMALIEASEVGEIVLGITDEQATLLVHPDNTLMDLHRLVAEFFGPRPLPEPATDDGALSMTPAEVEAELARDPLGRLVHVVTVPGGARSCGAETGQAVDFADFLRVTCPQCEEHLRVIAARLLVTLAFTADEPSLAELDMARDIEKTLGRN